MFIGDLKTQAEVVALKARLSAAVENKKDTITILNEMFLCDHVELLYHDEEQAILRDIINSNTITTEHFGSQSILEKVFFSKKSLATNNLIKHSSYNVALDNPYKLNISSQLLLCIVLNDKVQGIIRLSNNKEFDKIFLERIRLFINSFKDIFLSELYKKTEEVQSVAFDSNTTKIYMTLKKIKNLYVLLDAHTEHPEVKKLIAHGNTNVDTILEYVNPNIDNVSVVKQNLKKLKMVDTNNESKAKIRVLIADDVAMNVKILNAMLMDESIEEIQFAYDGIETISKVINSYTDNKLINVLFLDHHMPGKLGSEVAEILRKKGQTLYIVSITNDPEAIEEKSELYDYHISKPFTRACVLDVFNKIQNHF